MIDPRKLLPTNLGPEEVRRLLPHRPPLLLVDAVDALSTEPAALRAHRYLSADEPVFAGHFPGRPLWPGAYTIEGLAQCCALLGAILETKPIHALLASVDVKLLQPVLPEQTLEYLVHRTHVIDSVHRFDVEATVNGRSVAKGTLSCATVDAG